MSAVVVKAKLSFSSSRRCLLTNTSSGKPLSSSNLNSNTTFGKSLYPPNFTFTSSSNTTSGPSVSSSSSSSSPPAPFSCVSNASVSSPSKEKSHLLTFLGIGGGRLLQSCNRKLRFPPARPPSGIGAGGGAIKFSKTLSTALDILSPK